MHHIGSVVVAALVLVLAGLLVELVDEQIDRRIQVGVNALRVQLGTRAMNRRLRLLSIFFH